jgi:flavin reductase (DIM6/NTAB) family NADH-FMN oxidoreductase RutF
MKTNAIDPQTYRRVMALWPTGVSVITGVGPDQKPCGMVIGSFCSVSLEPALIAFFIKTNSATWKELQQAGGRFCVNVLSQDQAALCATFSTGDPSTRFNQVDFTPSDSGMPQLRQCCAWIEAVCEVTHVMGDHLMVLGRVESMQAGPNALPLVFARGRLSKTESLIQLREDHFEQWETAIAMHHTPSTTHHHDQRRPT